MSFRAPPNRHGRPPHDSRHGNHRRPGRPVSGPDDLFPGLLAKTAAGRSLAHQTLSRNQSCLQITHQGPHPIFVLACFLQPRITQIFADLVSAASVIVKNVGGRSSTTPWFVGEVWVLPIQNEAPALAGRILQCGRRRRCWLRQASWKFLMAHRSSQNYYRSQATGDDQAKRYGSRDNFKFLVIL